MHIHKKIGESLSIPSIDFLCLALYNTNCQVKDSALKVKNLTKR